MLKIDRHGRISLCRCGTGHVDFPAMLESYNERRRQDRETMERMIAYAQSGRCRWQLLMADLQPAADPRRCGACENCRRIAAHESAMARPIVVNEDAAASVRETPVFAVGDPVKVRRFGPGVVIAADATSITVGFADGTSRCFLPDYVTRMRSAQVGSDGAGAPSSSIASPRQNRMNN